MTDIMSGPADRGVCGYVVRRPMATDAVGGALLRAFSHAAAVPDDMRRCLDRLDRERR
ncbi:hypothetical protein [uncultured Sphingomonas sp.]|uniref:hypothetical protein n=1 Tax=uncultured Sphingomonas sp. TaxID=158754 RepID=UPI0035CA9C34